jgi:hypothetical protein
MATMTYDPTEVQEGELSEEEQDSLAVGEKLEEQSQELLAGKFKDAEALESAYVELQKKLGGQEEAPKPEAKTEEEPKEEIKKEEEQPELDGKFLDTLWEEANSEWTKETLDTLADMSPRDLAQMHLNYRNENQPLTKETMSEEDVTLLKSMTGGDEGYQSMMQWAQDSLNEKEISMYDQTMERGDPVACYYAVQSLAFRMRDNLGSDGMLLTGKAPTADKAASYRSQAEVVRDMSDPRYEKDPAYRQDVASKLENSPNIQF